MLEGANAAAEFFYVLGAGLSERAEPCGYHKVSHRKQPHSLGYASGSLLANATNNPAFAHRQRLLTSSS